MGKYFVSVTFVGLFVFVGLSFAEQSAPGSDWERTLAAAKVEGKVNLINRFPPSVRGTVTSAFKEKYAIDIEHTIGSLAEIAPKLESERRVGLYIRDVCLEGYPPLKVALVDTGIAEPIEPALILPEVKDGNAWRDKRLPFFDKDGKIFMYLSRVNPHLLINKDLVKPEEIKSWRNLLEPKWKGKILLYDPSINGPGNSCMTIVHEIMGIDYLKELAKQEPVINRDMRMQVEWVARGKYPVACGCEFALMEEMRNAGAPLLHVVPPLEGGQFSSGVGSLSMFNRPAHPNATKVFINWFLSKEGQTLYAKAAKEQSRRVDVKPELAPDRLFQEGVKYINGDTEYISNKRREMLSLSKEIFAVSYTR